MACYAKQMQIKEQDTAMTWNNQFYSGDCSFFAADNFMMAHSFEHVERPGLVAEWTSLRPESANASGNDGKEGNENEDLQIEV